MSLEECRNHSDSRGQHAAVQTAKAQHGEAQSPEAYWRSSATARLRIRSWSRRFRKSVLSVEERQHRTLGESTRELTLKAHNVVLLGRFYYVFLAYLVGTGHYPFGAAYSGGTPTAPIWPISLISSIVGTAWLRHEIVLTALGLLLALGAASAPGWFFLRLGAFLHLFVHIAIRNSYGSINHGTHVLLLVGFALIFLPNRARLANFSLPLRHNSLRGQKGQRAHQRSSVRACLTSLWIAQVAILLSYTLSGINKIWYGRLELFSSDALTRILLDRLLAESDEIPLLMPYVAQHNWLTQSMWMLTLYIEIFALLVIFRPHLHRLFGAIFMLFHITSDLLMNISFSLNIVMVGLFLLLSPLAPDQFSLSGTVRSLPIIGWPFRALKRRQQTRKPLTSSQVWLVYDGECPMCNNYAQYLRLQRSVDTFMLVDARQGGPIVDEIRQLPHDLNDGMVVKIDKRYFVGHEALNVLALLSEDLGVFNKFNRLAFASPMISRFTYPLMTAIRRMLLKRKGVEPIRQNDSPAKPTS